MRLHYETVVVNSKFWPNIIMPFKYNGDALYGGSKPYDIKTNFQVIITENIDGNCGVGGEILYHSSFAHLSSGAVDKDPNDAFHAFILPPHGSETDGKLFIKTDVDKFCPPFYTEDSCPADSASCGGTLKFCVELQALMCGRKVDFVDVAVEIKFDLKVDCAGDNCGEVILKRNDPVDENGHTEIGDIKCKPCHFDAGKESLTVLQGGSIEACIDMLTDGACVRKINNLDFIVERSKDLWKRYCIVSDDPLDECLFILQPGIDYDPTISGYTVDDAYLKFLAPGEEFQEISPGSTVPAHFSGDVTIGLGCCCDNPPPAGCDCLREVSPRRLERGLVSDGIANVVFVADEFGFTLEKADPTGPKCSENFFLNLLQILLGWLWSLLGKGRFCV